MKAVILTAALAALTLAPPVSPPPRIGHVMTTAGAGGGVLLLGGSSTAGDSLWWLSRGAWEPIASGGPVTRSMAAAAFDTRRAVLVIFGGAGTRGRRPAHRAGLRWQSKQL